MSQSPSRPIAVSKVTSLPSPYLFGVMQLEALSDSRNLINATIVRLRARLQRDKWVRIDGLTEDEVRRQLLWPQGFASAR
jgi:hypothetical protein